MWQGWESYSGPFPGTVGGHADGLTRCPGQYIVHMHNIRQPNLDPFAPKEFHQPMPRPRKHRNCRRFEGDRVFKPRSIPMPELELVFLGDDELEALRLCDLEGLDQAGAGERMGVSRGTVQRLLKSGREAVVRALVDGGALVIGETAKNPELEEDS